MDLNKIKSRETKLSRTFVVSSMDEHQMEFVDQVDGTAYINDSQSMTVNAVLRSLSAIETSVILITGGDDSSNDYSLLKEQIEMKVVAVIYLGSCSNNILKHYKGHSMLFVMADNIKEAVLIAKAYSKSGDAVLFAPACQDQKGKDTYRQRGREFKEIVKGLSA
ncbi:MAG: murD [Bacteroidota bacterium]|nr:murD [Bacteroidota bacterium]